VRNGVSGVTSNTVSITVSASAPTQAVTITSLVSSSIFKPGDMMTIRWSTSLPGTTQLALNLVSYKGGRTQIMKIGTTPASIGSLTWFVPAEVITIGGNGTGYAIEVLGDEGSTLGESQQFSITSNTVSLISGDRLAQLASALRAAEAFLQSFSQ
jgi:hypothetical protein